MKKKVTPLLVGIFCLLTWASYVSAVEIIVIDSPKVRINTQPGEKESGIIQVTNPSPLPKNVRLYLEDWYYLPPFDGSKEFKPAGSLPLSASSWISFIPKEFTIPPYGKKSVSYAVNLPKEAEGGHYAVLFFEMRLDAPENQAEGVNIGVAIRVASLFYIEPKGTILRQVELKNLSLDKDSDRLYLKADFNNTGNVDITSKGTFYIIDKKGMVYARGAFNDLYTLPQDKAVMTSSAVSAIAPGIYDLVITLRFQDGSVKVVEEAIRVKKWDEIELLSKQ